MTNHDSATTEPASGGLSAAEAAALRAELERAREEIADLKVRLLGQRDHVIGSEAEAARARVELEGVRARLRRVSKARKDLEEELEELRATTTWRVGQALVRPAARMSGRRR